MKESAYVIRASSFSSGQVKYRGTHPDGQAEVNAIFFYKLGVGLCKNAINPSLRVHDDQLLVITIC